MRTGFPAALLLGLALWTCAQPFAKAQMVTRQNVPGMTFGGAVGRAEYGQRADGRMTVTVTFTADDPAYAGETLYKNLPSRDLARTIYLKIGDRDYPVWFEDGTPQIPPELTLQPQNADAATDVVGQWQGTFVAPTKDMREIGLQLPGTGLIGPFPIRENPAVQ